MDWKPVHTRRKQICFICPSSQTRWHAALIAVVLRALASENARATGNQKMFNFGIPVSFENAQTYCKPDEAIYQTKVWEGGETAFRLLEIWGLGQSLSIYGFSRGRYKRFASCLHQYSSNRFAAAPICQRDWAGRWSWNPPGRWSRCTQKTEWCWICRKRQLVWGRISIGPVKLYSGLITGANSFTLMANFSSADKAQVSVYWSAGYLPAVIGYNTK